MSSNEYLTDAVSRHAVFVQRYSKGVSRVAGRSLDKILSEVIALIANDESHSIRAAMQTMYGELEQELLDEIISFAEQEAEFYKELLEKGTTIDEAEPVDLRTLTRDIETNPMDVRPGLSMTVRESLARFGQEKVQAVERVISDARTEGLTQLQVVARLRDALPLQKTQLGALVRTANNAASSIAGFNSFKANADVLLGYEWVSTLDSRTTLVCAGRDGKIYAFVENSPLPPAHWGCRSVIVPKVNPKYDLGADADGARPSVGAAGAQEVGVNTTYGGWLRKQPKSFVEEALGKARAKLFLSGKIPIEGFTDPTGREYTLDELRIANNLAF